ncbi:hypothetical protein [Bradyrhizobium yuanmingense]|uniref:hypothetical protein n=1 Tax=Bradyrhizobium yuanmingense TaxID=108015 RepID=UPI0023B90D76|nr:hypothetical protein [Bradyrhizobium yuanmingense]MDF0498635.1 hypothetical protein [Bradyrhizobium yuanmingense]
MSDFTAESLRIYSVLGKAGSPLLIFIVLLHWFSLCWRSFEFGLAPSYQLSNVEPIPATSAGPSDRHATRRLARQQLYGQPGLHFACSEVFERPHRPPPIGGNPW